MTKLKTKLKAAAQSIIAPQQAVSTMRLAMGIAALCLVQACSQQSSHESRTFSAEESAPAAATAMAARKVEGSAEDASAGVSFDEQLQTSVGIADDTNRQFVITANLHAQVADVYAVSLTIEKEAQKLGGFVTNNSVDTQSRNKRTTVKSAHQQLTVTELYDRMAYLQVRVPTAQTQTFLQNIAPHLEFLLQRSVNAQDVQLELLRERLRISRNRLLQQDADRVANTPEAKASQALSAIWLKSQAQYEQDAALLAQKEWQDRIEFSTIDLTLRQQPIVRTGTEPDTDAILKEASPSLGKQLAEALQAGGAMVVAMLVGLASVWPLLLIFAAAVLAWIVWAKKHQAKATSSSVAKEADKQTE